MTPEEAIERLISVLRDAATPLSEEDIYASLERAGVPDDVADRVYKFSQIACGRKFLDGSGVTFSNEYICFNAHGDVIESGEIEKEPYFVAAMKHVGPGRIRSEVFGNFAMMSADFHSVNSAMLSGSNPSNLIMAPAGLFLEAPTSSGFKKAKQVISEHVAWPIPENPPRRPWWKFW